MFCNLLINSPPSGTRSTSASPLSIFFFFGFVLSLSFFEHFKLLADLFNWNISTFGLHWSLEGKWCLKCCHCIWHGGWESKYKCITHQAVKERRKETSMDLDKWLKWGEVKCLDLRALLGAIKNKIHKAFWRGSCVQILKVKCFISSTSQSQVIVHPWSLIDRFIDSWTNNTGYESTWIV